jgi:hypothetical protein
MGRDFFPVLAAMLSWGDKWLNSGGGAPVTLCHHGDGHGIVSRVICEQRGDPVRHEDIRFCAGPGYPDDVRPELDMRSRLEPALGAALAERRPPVARGPPSQAGAPAESSCREITLLGARATATCPLTWVNGRVIRANGAIGSQTQGLRTRDLDGCEARREAPR